MAGTLGEAAVEIIAETGDFDDGLRRRPQSAIDDASRRSAGTSTGSPGRPRRPDGDEVRRLGRNLAGLGSVLHSLGVQAMQGFINGVQAMAGRLVSAAVAPIRNAINAVRNALSIGLRPGCSPRWAGSLVMRFIQGLAAEHRLVAQAARAVEQALAVPDPVAGALGPAEHRSQALEPARDQIPAAAPAAGSTRPVKQAEVHAPGRATSRSRTRM